MAKYNGQIIDIILTQLKQQQSNNNCKRFSVIVAGHDDVLVANELYTMEVKLLSPIIGQN